MQKHTEDEYLTPMNQSEQPLTLIEKQALKDAVDSKRSNIDFKVLWAASHKTHSFQDRMIREKIKRISQDSSIAIPLCFKPDMFERTYQQIVEREKKSHPQMFLETTPHRKFKRILSEQTRIEFQSNVLIGHGTSDLFTPALGTTLHTEPKKKTKADTNNGFKGLCIEIDGPVHNLESKGIRDMAKLETLGAINILSFSVENSDLLHPILRDLFDAKTNNSYKLCSRSRALIWQKIHFITVIALGSDEEWEKAFGISKYKYLTLKEKLQNFDLGKS